MENIYLFELFRWQEEFPVFGKKLIPAIKTKTYLPFVATSKFEQVTSPIFLRSL